MIKGVFIDIDNTLLDFHYNSFYALKSTFTKRGIEFKKEYFEVFLRINTALWDKIEKKEITRAEHKKVRFELIFNELGIKDDCAKIEDLFRSELFEFAYPIDGALELLTYLSGKYRLFVASNAMQNQQIARLKKASMIDFFEKVFISESIGHDKPTKGFFDYCYSVIENLSPSETVIIGDSLSADIKGGKDYGLTTVWFNPNEKTNPNPKIVDFEVKNLLDIKNFL